jgi:hypothetical protein
VWHQAWHSWKKAGLSSRDGGLYHKTIYIDSEVLTK